MSDSPVPPDIALLNYNRRVFSLTFGLRFPGFLAWAVHWVKCVSVMERSGGGYTMQGEADATLEPIRGGDEQLTVYREPGLSRNAHH